MLNWLDDFRLQTIQSMYNILVRAQYKLVDMSILYWIEEFSIFLPDGTRSLHFLHTTDKKPIVIDFVCGFHSVYHDTLIFFVRWTAPKITNWLLYTGYNNNNNINRGEKKNERIEWKLIRIISVNNIADKEIYLLVYKLTICSIQNTQKIT